MKSPPGETGASARTFVVRLWFEATDETGSRGEWRGQVREVPGGDTAYFRKLEGVVGALEKLGAASGPGRDEPRPTR